MRALLCSLVCIACAAAAIEAAQARGRNTGDAGTARCGDAVAFQVLLDRHGYSPGEIDGTLGVDAKRALAAFQTAHHLRASGEPDCATWTALDRDHSPVTTKYQITEADTAGPFTEKIPEQLDQQAQLSALHYRSPIERIAERFHAAPGLLKAMNPGQEMTAGATITVPAVDPFDEKKKPVRSAATADIRIEVSREGSLRAIRRDGSLEFFAPVTSGSEHDPLPLGDWRVTSLVWMPPFYYNPVHFWDAKPSETSATIPPGPNNPVGVVWVGLSIEHYGIHGTPDPSEIGHAQSHGCVRMTNWDAAHVAALVKVGTPVIFK